MENERKEICYKAYMNTYYEFREKMIRVTRSTRSERMKMIQLPFQEVTELPSLITE